MPHLRRDSPHLQGPNLRGKADQTSEARQLEAGLLLATHLCTEWLWSGGGCRKGYGGTEKGRNWRDARVRSRARVPASVHVHARVKWRSANLFHDPVPVCRTPWPLKGLHSREGHIRGTSAASTGSPDNRTLDIVLLTPLSAHACMRC